MPESSVCLQQMLSVVWPSLHIVGRAYIKYIRNTKKRKRREGKGREGKGREGKGREGKGREGKGREGKGREGRVK